MDGLPGQNGLSAPKIVAKKVIVLGTECVPILYLQIGEYLFGISLNFISIFRGAYCVGFSFDQTPCDPPKAKCQGPQIDGNWSAWSKWSQCSNPCINGQRSRAR